MKIVAVFHVDSNAGHALQSNQKLRVVFPQPAIRRVDHASAVVEVTRNNFLRHKLVYLERGQGGDFRRESNRRWCRRPRMAAMGRIKWPISVDVFKPPHLPRNSTPLGCRADSKSIIVAAFAEPMPKFTIDNPAEFVAACMGPALARNVAFEFFGKVADVVMEVGQPARSRRLIQRHAGVAGKPVSGNFKTIFHRRNRGRLSPVRLRCHSKR